MFKISKRLWAFLLITPLLAGAVVGQDYEDDEDYQEPAARVVRVSYLNGEAQIKRIENEEWESVVSNLPLVEGDTIQTERGSRLEIQLDRYSFVRLDGDSTLKFTFLADEGIAISLSRGTLGVTLIRFDKNKSYLEIDAPSSTVAIQKSGVYRIDAGDEYNKEVRVSVRDDGEARVYSRDSGFVLKDGRSARLFLDGVMAGEWETSRNSRLSDSFDGWIRDQDERIAADLADRDDKYFDDDIYGADDLRDHGDWIYTSDYGYVWSPYSRSIASYSNWSPYRYGHWRWLPYYGWTWVNDEPWGWATYHYGRWIYYRGRWCWSPYRRYRSGRSWRPAIVYVTYIGNSYCWYPLPWGYGYYDYNRRFRDRWQDRRHYGGSNSGGNSGGNTGGGGGGNTVPSIPQANIDRANRLRTPPLSVPATGVVTVPADEFGKRARGFDRPPLSVARKVLDQKPMITESPPLLPSLDDLDGKLGKEIRVSPPARQSPDTKTGAVTRKTASPLDEKLLQEKMYGNRTPRDTDGPVSIPDRSTRKPRTGVFDRSKSPVTETKQEDSGTVYTPPIIAPRESKPAPRPTYRPETKQPDRSPPPVNRNTQRDTSPKYEPAPSPPPRREPPRRAPDPPPPSKSPPPQRQPEQKAPDRKPPESKPSESPKEKPDNR